MRWLLTQTGQPVFAEWLFRPHRPLFGPPEAGLMLGAPFAPAIPEGPAKRRGQTPAKQPEGRGATRRRSHAQPAPSPASMASGVDLIAAPGGT